MLASKTVGSGFIKILKKRRMQLWGTTVLVIVGLLLVEMAFPWLRTVTMINDKQTAPVFLLIFMAAMFCEYIDSALGMGYGTTLTPLLLIGGYNPLQIVPCILFSELVTGVTAGVMHHRDGNVDFRSDAQARKTTAWLSVLSAAGAISAAFVAVKIPRVWLNLIIAIIIVSVGIVILTTMRHKFRYRTSHIILVGGVAAFNKGLSGGGYGPLVTAGQVVSGVAPKSAVAITSLAESVTCAIGLAAYMALQRGQVDFSLAVPLLLGAILSVPMATLTVRHIPERLMRAGVGVTTCLLGVVTLCKLLSN